MYGLRILICDDDETIIKQLQDYICEFFRKNEAEEPVIATYGSGDDLLEHEKEADIAFLDVEMPGRSGIATGSYLKNHNPHILLFIVTSYPDYLDDAMRVQVFRYLSKPIDKSRLFRNLKDALQIFNTEKNPIPVETSAGIVTVPSNEIVCVEAIARKTFLYTASEQYRTVQPLNSWRCLLKYPYFYSPHRSYIINMFYVSQVQKDKIVLKRDLEPIEAYLTRRKYREFRDTYLTFMESVR